MEKNLWSYIRTVAFHVKRDKSAAPNVFEHFDDSSSFLFSVQCHVQHVQQRSTLQEVLVLALKLPVRMPCLCEFLFARSNILAQCRISNAAFRQPALYRPKHTAQFLVTKGFLWQRAKPGLLLSMRAVLSAASMGRMQMLAGRRGANR
jgi:hypothetical protein